jgi:hypothetical protein
LQKGGTSKQQVLWLLCSLSSSTLNQRHQSKNVLYRRRPGVRKAKLHCKVWFAQFL